MLSIFSNMVLVVPTATTFRKYHQEHHSHLVRTLSVAQDTLSEMLFDMLTRQHHYAFVLDDS